MSDDDEGHDRRFENWWPRIQDDDEDSQDAPRDPGWEDDSWDEPWENESLEDEDSDA